MGFLPIESCWQHVKIPSLWSLTHKGRLKILDQELVMGLKTRRFVFSWIKFCSFTLRRRYISLQGPLREKCPYSKFFWSIFSRIWTEYGKIRTRKSSNRDTFHAVAVFRNLSNIYSCQKLKAMEYFQKQPKEVFYRKGVLKLSQISQENTNTGAFLWTLQNF